MTGHLDADDIARITASVLEKLGDKEVDSQALTQAVKSAAERLPGLKPELPKEAPTPAQAAANDSQRIIIASFGLNRPGIVASISAVLAENGCSIADMSQRIMQEFYTLIMIVDIAGSSADFAELSDKLKAVEERLGVTVFVQHEDVFRFMHRV